MTSIYLTFTPLHILTSCGLALRDSQNENKILLIIEDFPHAKKYISSILNWESNPFNKTYLITGKASITKKLYFLKYFYYQKKIIKIKNFWSKINNKNGINLYLFNDRTLEGQFFLSKNKGKSSCNVYVDDGIESYIPTPTSKFYSHKLIIILRKIVAKLLFGFWYEIQNFIGLSKKINKMLSFFPEKVINQYKLKYLNIIKIPDNLFYSLDKSGLVTQIFKNFTIEIDESFSFCIILLLNTEFFHVLNLKLNDVKKSVEKIIKLLENYFETIYLKYHPREYLVGFIKYQSKKLKLIDNSLAAELIFLLLNTKTKAKKLLIGPKSTAFITARLIMKNKISIISLDKILQKSFDNPSIFRIFKRFNILSPNNFSELDKIIKNI